MTKGQKIGLIVIAVIILALVIPYSYLKGTYNLRLDTKLCGDGKRVCQA